jgi:AcrR family transcriptional regulator
MSIKTGMKRKKTTRAVGRPRSFDTGKALDAAMNVFWRKGYEGASLSELTKAMGVNRPSLYAAFGDKEALFRKVLDRYDEGPAAYLHHALNRSTARAAVEALMLGAADLVTSSGNPVGCLFVQGALACGDGAEAVRGDLILRRAAGEKAVRQRLKRAQAEGDLPPEASPADLARFVVTVVHGIAVQAASGAARNELRRVVRTALQAWPK